MRVLLLIGVLMLPAGRAGGQAGAPVVEGLRALEAGRFAQAQELLHRAERQHPRDPQVLASLAWLYATPPLTDRPRAVDYVRRGLLRHPHHPDLLRVRLRLALADTAGARFERMEALRTLSRRLLRQEPHDPDALLACGIGRYDDVAWRLGSRATTLDGNDLQRRYARAAGCLDTLLAVAPDHLEARRRRMQLAFLLDRPRDAARVADALLTDDADDSDLWRWRGLAAHLDDDPATAARHFDRAFALAAPDDRQRWRDPASLQTPDAPDADVAAFWQTRDPLLSTPVNERWVEHMARLALIDLFFAEEGGVASARGNLLVRYGLPENAVEALSGYGAFVSPQEGRLIAWDYGDFRMVFQDWFLSGEFKFYSPPAAAFSGREIPNDYVLIARSLVREMPERMILEQARALGPFAAYEFQEGTQAEVVTAVASQASESVRVFGVSEDDVTQAASLSTGSGFAVHRMRLAPGRYRLQAEQETPGGWAVRQDSLVISTPTGSLALSSIVPATLVEEGARLPGSFQRHGFSVVPAPERSFRTGAPLYLYAEFYGLRPDTTFEVEIEAVRERGRGLLGRKKSGVAVRFPETAASTTEARYYVLDTTQLEPGTYTVRITVHDALGRTVQAASIVTLE